MCIGWVRSGTKPIYCLWVLKATELEKIVMNHQKKKKERVSLAMRQRKRNIFKIQQNHQSSKKKMQAFVINLPRRVYRRDANVCHWWFWQVEKWVWRGVVCTEKNECRGGGDRTEYSCQMSSGLEKWLIWKSTDLHLNPSQVVLTGDNSRKQPWIDEKKMER